VFLCIVSVFILFVFAQNAVWKNVLEKKNRKEFEKERERGSPPCRPGGPASPWFLPQPAAQLAAHEEQARAPLPSLSLLSAADNQSPPGSALLFFFLRS